MSLLTRFFNLIKPAKTDGVKVADFNANMDTIDAEMHKPPLTVNGVLPDPATRNIALETVPLADNLSSDDAQFSQGTFIVRTSGGNAAIANGAASLSTIRGNMVKTGYEPEVLEMNVNAVPRVAPPAITAVLDAETFEAYVATAGTYVLNYATEWSANPTLYGVTVTNTPVAGDNITIVWDGETEPEMTVNAVERPVPAPITATIDKAVFRAYVTASGTVTLSFTTDWSVNPALYGITVANTPVSGDSIIVEYVKENRGTITPANVTVFNSTGWNLFQTAQSYARVVRYSDEYGYKIGGSYSLVNFAETPTGTSSAISVDADGYFNVPSDGYVIVTGADDTTYVYATWEDWTEGYEGEFEPYTDYAVDFSSVMVFFNAGLLAIGDVRDEINFNTQKAISRIERLAYTPENLEDVIASGRPYETDTNYIYCVRASYVETDIAIDGTYTVSDHGIEFYTATTTTPPVTECIYGNNLKDKLRMDVLTISAQTLSASQKAQVQSNIGLGAAATKAVANNLTTASAGASVLDAYQGKVLKDGLDTLNSKMQNPLYVLNISSSAPSTWSAFIALMNKGAGTYYINTTSSVRSTLNSAGIIPTTEAGIFIVNYSASNLFTLEYIPYISSDRYTASYYSNGFKGWEKLALNSNITDRFGKSRVLKFLNVSTISFELPFAPSSSLMANGLLYNANQQLIALIKLDQSPTITRTNGALTLTLAVSNKTVTITSSGTLWGITNILLDWNY